MTEFEYTITDEVGIHARPAGLLVRLAEKYNAEITIVNGNKSADAKRIFSVMGLGAKCGDTVKVQADGDDAQKAVDAIRQFMEEHL